MSKTPFYGRKTSLIDGATSLHHPKFHRGTGKNEKNCILDASNSSFTF